MFHKTANNKKIDSAENTEEKTKTCSYAQCVLAPTTSPFSS